MTTAGTPMGEGRMPSEREERRYGRYDRDRRHARVDEESAEIIAGGSVTEAILGLGAVVLGILGLLDILPSILLTVGLIAVGVGLVVAGGSKAAKYRELLGERGRRRDKGLAAATGGLTAETLGGIAGATLGLLALIGLEPAIMASVAIIVLGGAVMFAAGATRRLASVIVESSGAPKYRQKAVDESVRGASAAQAFLGLGALVLGVMTFFGIGPAPILKLVSIIALGTGLVLSGLAIGGKMIRSLYKEKKAERGERHGKAEYAEYRRDEGYGGERRYAREGGYEGEEHYGDDESHRGKQGYGREGYRRGPEAGPAH